MSAFDVLNTLAFLGWEVGVGHTWCSKWRGPYEMPGSKPRLATCKANPYLLIYCSDPARVFKREMHRGWKDSTVDKVFALYLVNPCLVVGILHSSLSTVRGNS